MRLKRPGTPAGRAAPRAVLAAILLAAGWATAGAAGERLELVFERLNGGYRDLQPELAPVSAAGMSVRLRSPANSVRLYDNRLLLTTRPGGHHALSVWAEIEAVADLEADLEVGGVTNRLEDRIAVPRQKLALRGVVQMERTETGYLVTVIEAPEVLELAIESRLGGSLVELCRLVPWAGGGCDALERGLSSVRVPMPRPGERLAVDAAYLLAAERMLIDRYLESAETARPPD